MARSRSTKADMAGVLFVALCVIISALLLLGAVAATIDAARPG